MNKRVIKIIAVIVGAILIGWLAALFTFENVKDEKVVEEKVVYVKESGEKLENFSKDEAFKSLQTLMKESLKDVEGKKRKPEERIEALEKDKDITKVMHKDALDLIHFDNDWGTVNDNQISTAVGLIVQSTLLNDMNEKDFEALLPIESDKIAVIDEVTQKAFISLDVFAGMKTGMSAEMEYIDGEWKLDPYSLVRSMELTDIIMFQFEAMQEDAGE